MPKTEAEMDTDTTYIICPEKSCRLFWDTSQPVACDGHCPYQDRQQLIIICSACGEMVTLPEGHHVAQRIDHQCPDGSTGMSFRMGRKYELMYEVPQEEEMSTDESATEQPATTYQEILARADELIGRDLEIQTQTLVWRGPITNIKSIGTTQITIEVGWIAEARAINWNKRPECPWEKSRSRLYFWMPSQGAEIKQDEESGAIKINPKDRSTHPTVYVIHPEGDNLDRDEVEG